jgi:hypothetical protein
MKKASKNMEIMYIKKRNTTLDLIRDAIDTIQEDNKIVTKKELMDITGLSSGTFSKEYVKELLNEKEVCQYRKINSPNVKVSEISQLHRLDESIRENKKLQSENQNLKMLVERQEKKINKTNEEYITLKNDYDMLLGKHQQILEYLDSIGSNKAPYIKII